MLKTGTGSYPGLGKKRQGRHSPGSKSPYLLVPERMRSFVVPNIEEDCAVSFVISLHRSYTQFLSIQLKPFVLKQSEPPRLPAEKWPQASSKAREDLGSKRQGVFGQGGFDGEYLVQLARYANASRRAVQ